ncbi:hypothetical protein ACVBEF_20775, partial [Glaciimonas sp. GG7]
VGDSFSKRPVHRARIDIDFDERVENRLPEVRAAIPQPIADRVYVLGTASEPERLKVAMGKSLETIGLEAAQQCAEEKDDLWQHALLQHNQAELARLSRDMRDIVIQK